jgi:hypothetical protein
LEGDGGVRGREPDAGCGLVTLCVGILDFIPKNDTTAALLGFFDRARSLLSLAAIVGLFAGYGRSSSGAIALAYGLVATALPVRWFFTRRSRTI